MGSDEEETDSRGQNLIAGRTQRDIPGSSLRVWGEGCGISTEVAPKEPSAQPS